MGTKQFWMVWNVNGRSPTQRHATKADAEWEACRLFEKSPRDTFYVLEAVAKFAPAYRPLVVTNLADGMEVQPPREVKIEADEIPF